MKVPADAPTEKRRLDLSGAALATLAFGALAYGLTSMSAEAEGHMSGPHCRPVAARRVHCLRAPAL
jgi:hypothetical protein